MFFRARKPNVGKISKKSNAGSFCGVIVDQIEIGLKLFKLVKLLVVLT